MSFTTLHELLVVCVRERIQNGELTERSLARMAHISQPHIHNVLKGGRFLSTKFADRILAALQISILDLARDATAGTSGLVRPELYASLPILKGRLGPSDPWPTAVDAWAKLRVSAVRIASMVDPVAAQLGRDPRMTGLFDGGDTVVLDQSLAARRRIQSDQLYLLKFRGCGMVRYLRCSGDWLYLISDDARLRPESWERLSMTEFDVDYVVRARVNFVGAGREWDHLEKPGYLDAATSR